MNLVITSMVNHTALNITSGHQDGPFVWDSVITCGYMVFQMPGGRMAEVFGGKKVFTVGNT